MPAHPAGLLLEALEREREVRAALGVGDGVDLIDDHGVHRTEHVARLGGEDEIQRLGGGDEDVGRVSHHCGALALRRVAGPDGDGHVVRTDPPQGDAEVALDVVGERLQRADVDDPRALAGHTVGA